eukprot:1154547-Pelagomonas_calceolata.AAC.1
MLPPPLDICVQLSWLDVSASDNLHVDLYKGGHRRCDYIPYIREDTGDLTTSLQIGLILCCGLDRRNSFAECVYSGQPINIKEFVVDLRKRHRSVWPTENQAEHDEHPNKLAKYHNWVALPFRHDYIFGKPLHVPRYFNLYI